MKKLLSIALAVTMTVLIIPGCNNESAIDKNNPFFSEFDTPFNVPPFEKIMAKHDP